MAIITTTSTPTGVTTIWANPSNIGGNVSGIPLAKVVYRDTVTIPAKLAANTNVVNVTCVLPVNYAYRVTYQQFSMLGENRSYPYDFQGAAIGSIGDINGILSRYLILNHQTENSSSGNAAYAQNGLGTQNVSEYICPDQSALLVDNSHQGGVVTAEWVDLSTDSTVEVSLVYRIEALMYSLDALNSWKLNTPNLVTQI